MDPESTCWKAAHTEIWTLKAELTSKGWLATVYNHGEARVAYSELAVDAAEAQAKAQYFLVGMVPPITFHEGTSIALQWTPCSEEIEDSK